MMLRRFYTHWLERLYLRAIQQAPPLPGTDPDDGEHGELRVAWNDPVKGNRPLFVVIMSHIQRGRTARLIMSPRQVDLLRGYIDDAIDDQSRKFHYTETPDWDTRFMRAPE
jgi:hypothetical protein